MAENYPWPVARKFFVTGGKAQAETRKGAVQKAFIDAKIEVANLEPVSSVLNAYAERLTEIPKISHAAFVKCVMAQQEGYSGESIAAGIGWCYMRVPETGELKGYVVEDHGKGEERAVRKTLIKSLMEMAEAQNLEIIPLEKTGEPLKTLKHYQKEQKTEKPTTHARYLDEQAKRYFGMEIRGIDEIEKPFGCTVAALVYVPPYLSEDGQSAI